MPLEPYVASEPFEQDGSCYGMIRGQGQDAFQHIPWRKYSQFIPQPSGAPPLSAMDTTAESQCPSDPSSRRGVQTALCPLAGAEEPGGVVRQGGRDERPRIEAGVDEAEVAIESPDADPSLRAANRRTTGTTRATRSRVQRTPLLCRTIRPATPAAEPPRQIRRRDVHPMGQLDEEQAEEEPGGQKRAPRRSSIVLSTRTAGMPSVSGDLAPMRKARAASPPTLAVGKRRIQRIADDLGPEEPHERDPPGSGWPGS